MKYPFIAALAAWVCLSAACSESVTEDAKTERQQTAAEKRAEKAASAKGASQAKAVSAQSAPSAPPAEAVSAPSENTDSTEAQIKRGKALFESNCLACHGAEGKGVEGTFPPLAQSDYFAKDSGKIIRAVVKGVNGTVKVNGKTFNGVMPAVALSDQDTADVVTFVLNSFGNGGGRVSAKDVEKARAK